MLGKFLVENADLIVPIIIAACFFKFVFPGLDEPALIQPARRKKARRRRK